MDRNAGLLDELYSTIGDRGFAALPELIASAAGGRSCAFQVVTRDMTPLVVKTSYFSPAMVRFYVEQEIYRDDVWQKPGIVPPMGKAVNLRNYVPDETYLRSRFYQEMIRGFGDDTGQCIGLILPTGGETITIGVHRALRQPRFEQSNIDALDSLVPHLRRVISTQLKLQAYKTATATWEAALKAMPHAAMIVSPSGAVTLANAQARTILQRHDGLALAEDRLQLATSHEAELYARYLHDALARRGGHGGALLVSRTSARKPYSLVVQPFDSGERTHALVLIGDPDDERPGRGAMLRQLYGLTGAEAEVALLVASGLPIEEVADRRGVTVATAKTLLQRAYQKTDVSKATELARIVAGLPA